MTGYAEGGYIGPPSEDKDSIPFVIHPGEEYFTAEQVKRYGLEVLARSSSTTQEEDDD